MRVSIFGLGYVGAVTAGCLANAGHTIVGVDPQQAKVDLINGGQSPIQEKGLDELLAKAVAQDALQATTDAAWAVANTDVSIVCVGTPPAKDWSLDLSHVHGVAGEIAGAIRGKGTRHELVFRSTMLPGSCRGVIKQHFEDLVSSGLVRVSFYPEFLREGSAIADFNDPSLSVVGLADPTEGLGSLSDLICWPTELVDYETAEMIKYACNAFHAVKVAFANEIGALAKASGVDGRTVMKLVCTDTRLNISSRYLRPGTPFGGSCLPKDVAALTHFAARSKVDIPAIENLAKSNEAHLGRLEALVMQGQPRKAAILGVAFKAGTDDLRGSPMLQLAARLRDRGIAVAIYDPWVKPEALLGANAAEVSRVLPHLAELMQPGVAEAVSNAEVILAALPCTDLDTLRSALSADQRVIDINGWPGLAEIAPAYEGLCW
jgi:GDP-mannose 6-dehydrogenase